MQSTHTSTVKALSDVPLLHLRFSYLSQKFLVYSYPRSGDALRVGLKTLTDLGSGKNMKGYPWVEPLYCIVLNTVFGYSCVSKCQSPV
jgi:hypothetical protein